MSRTNLQLQGFSDPRLAIHAAGALPAWLWSADGSRVLWCNPMGARTFGATNGIALAARTFGPADAHRRQIAELARRLPENGAVRLERLRGFGAPLGTLATCGCARIDLGDGSHGVLITTTDAGVRPMPLAERLQRLVDDTAAPLAAFTADGLFVGASASGRKMFGLHDLSEGRLAEARQTALAVGRAEAQLALGRVTLYRVGTGSHVGLIALVMPAVDTSGPPERPEYTATAARPDDIVPARSNAAPTEILLFDDEFADASEPVTHTRPMTDESESAPPAHEAATPLDVQNLGEPHHEGDASAPSSAQAPAGKQDVEASQAPPPAQAPTSARRHPLRFMWQIDSEERFSLMSDEFVRLIGPHVASNLGRRWHEIADILLLDLHGRVSAALESRETWSGIMVPWPVDGGGSLPVELAGLPIFDDERQFHGYRGFGICRDLDALDGLEARRRAESPCSATDPTAIPDAAQSNHISAADKPPGSAILAADGAEAPGNVVQFRPAGETKFPALTAVENSAFHELARQLSARLEGDFRDAQAEAVARIETETTPRVTEQLHEPRREDPAERQLAEHHAAFSAHNQSAHNESVHEQSAYEQSAYEQSADDQPDWLTPEAPVPQGDSQRDRLLLDLMPAGVLIYRLDRLLYANEAFLSQMGYASLTALEQAGGLDALYVEPGVSSSSSTSETGMPVTITAADGSSKAGRSAAARLFTISWDGDTAHALIFTPVPGAAGSVATPAAPASPPYTQPAAAPTAPPLPQPLVIAPPPAGRADAEDLSVILDATTEGILMFDAGGNIHACNRSAAALFGHDGAELVRRNLIELFAPESTRLVLDYLDSVREADAADVSDQGHEVTAKVSPGGLIQLSITIRRTRPRSLNFFAVFRDLAQTRRGENELLQARRLADRAASAKADMLARISHEVRAPLNAIIGFAEVMIGERFGALGNERYADYMRDIRSSGERVITLINDLLELSRIETGKLELAFANQNLNELVESCVAVMQPQANRARIIIRTSLSHALPPVVADARALRQIALNLISTSIALANPGGQVIVSTAMSDFGEVMLRVRDTGHALNDQEVAAALEPFRPQPPSEQASDGNGLSLSLTKALVEANRAQFHIKAAPKSGTLMEVVFSRAMARNQSIG
jgi:PAS domain S-box-containing protein